MWRPTHIVLDSTELVADLRVTSTRMSILRAYCQKFDTHLIVPRVVRLEVANHIASRVRDAIISSNETTKAYRDAGLPLPEFASLNDPAGLVSSAQERFQQRLVWLGAETLAFPDFSHEQVVTRLLQERRPFRGGKAKEVGYRDFLLWKNVMSLQGRVAFVTSNTKDFGEKSDSGVVLHSDLQDDAIEEGREVRLFPALSHLTRDVLQPQFSSLAQAQVESLVLDNREMLADFAWTHLEHELIAASPSFSLRDFDITWAEEAAEESGFGKLEVIGDAAYSEVLHIVVEEGLGGMRLEVDKISSFNCNASVGIAQTLQCYLWYGSAETIAETREIEMQVELEFTVRDEGDSLEPDGVSLARVRDWQWVS